MGVANRLLAGSHQVGLIQTDMDANLKREAYAADVTYVTNSEVGFDYLRDNLSYLPETLVQRDFKYCIIDEVDSILIDEARTPLIISSTSDKPSGKYFKVCGRAWEEGCRSRRAPSRAFLVGLHSWRYRWVGFGVETPGAVLNTN